MAEKIIKDIRIYKSDIPNVDGNSTPGSFAPKQMNVMIHRIVMKLREGRLVLGDFDHLYLNFTTCVPEGSSQPANRSPDRYYPWYRYYDVGVSEAVYEELGSSGTETIVTALVEKVLLEHFAKNDEGRLLVKNAIAEAVSKGPDMLMQFKEKQAAKAGGYKTVTGTAVSAAVPVLVGFAFV